MLESVRGDCRGKVFEGVLVGRVGFGSKWRGCAHRLGYANSGSAGESCVVEGLAIRVDGSVAAWGVSRGEWGAEQEAGM